MRVRRAKRREWKMSFASMSDIAFLLIIFFAVAGKFTESGEKEVVLPHADLGQKSQPRSIEVVVRKDGTFLVGDVLVEQEDQLNEEVADHVAGDSSREARTVTLFADRDAEYGQVTKAIEAINKADAYLEMAVKESY